MIVAAIRSSGFCSFGAGRLSLLFSRAVSLSVKRVVIAADSCSSHTGSLRHLATACRVTPIRFATWAAESFLIPYVAASMARACR